MTDPYSSVWGAAPAVHLRLHRGQQGAEPAPLYGGSAAQLGSQAGLSVPLGPGAGPLPSAAQGLFPRVRPAADP